MLVLFFGPESTLQISSMEDANVKKVFGICGIALGLLLVVILIHVTKAAPVAAANTPAGTNSNPIFVEDVDNPARAPFAVTLCNVTLNPANCGSTPHFVPAALNQRTVIEQISGECSSDSLSNGVPHLEVSVAGATGFVTVLPQAPNIVLGSGGFLIPATRTRVYPDPGTDIIFSISPASGSAGTTGITCNVSLFGYTVRP
jgi:hypothetical protein